MSYLNQIIRDNEIIEIRLPLEQLLYTRQHIDLVLEYLQISYCAESIGNLTQVEEADTVRDRGYRKYFKMIIKPLKVNELIEFVYYAVGSLNGEIEGEEIDTSGWFEDIETYEDSLSDRTFHFPEFIDSYYANLIHGVYSEYKPKRSLYKKYPERAFGYWKSAASNSIGYTFYVSPEAWLVPKQADFKKILKYYSDLEDEIILENAELYYYNDSKVYLTAFHAVRLKEPYYLVRARKCADALVKRELSKPTKKFMISEFGDLLIMDDDDFYFVYFSNEIYKFNFEESKDIFASINPVYDKVQSLIGLSARIECDWSSLDDDSFEELCYDIVYYNPRFDSNTIQKMGKSRSRDGGRDIGVWTKSLPGQFPIYFIFQCKFIKPKSSLSASKLGNASNVILQYNAGGYGVFTTGVIDSTLYDMLKGFSNSIGIDTKELWSIYELERFLARHPPLKNRYFSKI